MRSLLLVAAALTLTSETTQDSTRDYELTVRVSGDALITYNPTAEPELVILRDPSTGAASSFFVPAMSRAELEIPCDIRRDLRVFGSVRTEEGTFYTDQWSLSDLEIYGTVWLECDEGVAFSWIQTESGFVPVGPTEDPLPPSTLLATSTAHVSVITPYDSTTIDAPPPLPAEPLPPL